MSLILRSYLYFATENSTSISIQKKINLLIFFRKNMFVVDGLDQLLVTHSVEKMLWSNYNPRAESPPSGVILAGRNYTSKNTSRWYSTVAVQSETAFDLLSPENQQSPLFNYLHSHSTNIQVIPWFQYNSRKFTPDFRQFCEKYVKNPFSGIIVLKPTSEEGKRHFDIRYFSGQEDYPLPSISAHKVPPVAQQHISSLIQYWVTADRFVKKGLQVL